MSLTLSTADSYPQHGHVIIDSPIGRIALMGDDEAVDRLEIARGGMLSTDHIDIVSTPVLDQAAAEIAEYFAGERAAFEVPVRLPGTAFQRAVWQQLQSIPFGEVRGYGDLGRALGHATAGRAVGGAVGANPVPLMVPCHRVLGTAGRITGYSAGDGVVTKAWLLDHEGIAHR